MLRADRLICAVALASVLAACAIIDVVDPRYDSINRSTAKARNESVLLNIVRASHNVPLNFVAFSKVSGQTTVGAGAALPQFTLGGPSPPRTFLFTKDVLTASTSANNTFDISPLETKDFYQGLLRPVDLPVVNYFIRQGYSRELLFWLFVESVRQTVRGQTIEFVNDPDDRRSCQIVLGQERCFRHMVDVAVASGLTVETKIDSGSGGSGGKSGGKGKGKGDGESKGGGGGSGRTIARLCFDPVLAQRAKKEYDPEVFSLLLTTSIANHRPRCKIDPWEQKDETDTLVFNFAGTPFGTVTYEIIPRSTFGIYQFLGRILALGLEQTIRLRGTVIDIEDRSILGIRRDGAGGCVVDVAFEDEYYCVPLYGAENAKRIIGLLTQLVALNTNALDLAITPTVRVQ